MTKQELIDRIAKLKDLPKNTNKRTITMIVDSVFEEIRKSVKKDGKFAYPHFGTFVKKRRNARRGLNPRTKAPIKIPARKTVVFRPASMFKEELAK